MAVPPLIPSWDQPTADRFLAACTSALGLVGALAADQRGLDRLAREQWRGPSRERFDELVARREGALDDLYAALWSARAAVERASAAAPVVILRAAVEAMPLVPGSS